MNYYAMSRVEAGELAGCDRGGNGIAPFSLPEKIIIEGQQFCQGIGLSRTL
jgi:hypothetical protein